MTPVAVTGFNRDVVIENTAAGPPYSNYAGEFNANEGTAFYQGGLAGTTLGLPVSGAFTSSSDTSTIFQFQPYTTNNALVLGPDTGVTNGTLTLVTPAIYATISVIANSGNGSNTSGPETLSFKDGSTIVTTFNAPNWFNNTANIALGGVERINLKTAVTGGAPSNPQFIQTTINIGAMLGASNKPLASLTFGKALANTTGIYAVSGLVATNMTPIAVTGFNRDMVVENNAAGPPYTSVAAEFNPGEGSAFYQSGLSNTTYGLPVTGFFSSTLDGTQFQFQPYTGNNALVMSGETGITTGTLTLSTPAVYGSVAILANSANALTTSVGSVSFNFTDGTSFVTNFDAADWFFNTTNVALLGVDRIDLTSGAAEGGPSDPRFYQTSYNLSSLLGTLNRPLASLTFGQGSGASATAVYALSGILGSQTNIPVALPVVTNSAATSVGSSAATFGGQILNTGGQAPSVTLFYGSRDGGTNIGAWAQSVVLGTEVGTFVETVSGLSSNTTYYFTAQATNSAGAAWATPSFSFTTLATNAVVPLVAMLTYHNDNTRQGVNTNEAILTPANVNVTSFGKLFTYPVDGYVYAQPLVMTNVNIPGKGIHNVVYVATEHESVYAFDADNNVGSNSVPLWQITFLNPALGITNVPGGDVGTSDITPEIGITATPVIDPVTGTIYIEGKTKETTAGVTTYVHRLHALDITTGAERTSGLVSNSPVVINCTNYPGTGQSGYTDNDGNGHVIFNTLREHSRPALTLLNGVIYLSFASHGDNSPYHGWLFSYDAHSLKNLSVFNSTPNGGLGGFWQGGGGATVDSSNNFYMMTGNGSFNATSGQITQAGSFAMSVLKFAPTNGVVTLVDYFSPHDEATLSGGDEDLGSGAAIVLPDSAGSVAHPHLLAAAGKGGRIYLLDRDNLGKFNSTNDNQIVQELPSALGTSGQNGSYMTPVFFNNTPYYIGMNNFMEAFPMSGGLISATPSMHTSTIYGDKGSSSPSLSANGTNNGIIWALESDAYASSGPEILHAYNATNLATELYNSSMNQSRDGPGAAVKFAAPTVVNGKVYVGAEYALSVFGANPFLAIPVISPPGGTFTNSVSVTLSDTTPGVSLYYTLTGSTPTTNSILYGTPFTLTNSVNVRVVAVKPGSVNSAVASAGFINNSSVGEGVGLLGQYWSNQVMTFNGSPALVRTDAVVDFSWGSAGPDPKVGGTNYTVKWTGMVQPQFSETYTFYASTDNGVRLSVNGHLLINDFTNQAPQVSSGTITLQAQQFYNIEMDYFHTTGSGAGAELEWSSLSTPAEVIPETQLYPVTNPPPAIELTGPANGATFTGTASVTFVASAVPQNNAITNVAFYTNNIPTGSLTNSPYILTVTGFAPGTYTLTAVASDTTGLTATSAPVMITVGAGSGQAYGLTNRGTVPAFFNMPGAFDGHTFTGVPTILSQTGVFTNTPNMTPAGGLVPYSPNVPLWSDGALKMRYLAVPNTGVPITMGQQIEFAPTGAWSFPSGTVFVKTFELLTNTSDPTSILRLETRLIVRDTNGAVYGVTYKWRPDNSEADLLTTSSNQAVSITTPAGVVTQTWYYPSPADCLTCHTPVANYVLGVNTRQLNGNLTYPATGNTDNQLRTLNRLGILYPAINEADITNFEQLFSLTNLSASTELRTRSYLDANCAQCHQPGGTGPTFDARFDTPLTNQNIIFGVLAKGNLGYDNAYVVTPKDIYRSVLYDRMNTVNPSIQMPTLARNLIDTNALSVIAAWIDSLPGTLALNPPVINPVAGTYKGFVNVSLQPPDANAMIYYTLDGSLPTTNSTLYTSPFMLATNAIVSANAFEPTFNNSVAATAAYSILPNVLYAAPNFFTNGTFQVELSGVIGKSYVLQASTDLKTWVPLSTNLFSVDPSFLVDPGASNFPARFYRVIELQ